MATIRTTLRRFGHDRRGLAAIEFAFIAPILLMMYFLTMETTQAIETNRKVGRVSSMVADLVTQQQGTVKKADLEAIMKIADTTLLPYRRSTPKIIVTGISIGGDPLKATVSWSRKVDNGTYSADTTSGTETTVPADLKVANTFLVKVQTDLNYRPVIAWSADGKKALGLSAAFSSLPLSETYYLRPRMTSAIICSDC